MNSLRNKVQLIGRLGQNPEVRSFDNGKTMAKFSLATKDSYVDAAGKRVTETQWHNIIAWGPLAKIAGQYLVKGSEVAVEGKITHRPYEDKDGKKCYFTEIVLNDMVMFRGNSSTGAE